MKLKSKYLSFPSSFILLSLLFLIINLIQASFTELANDEAYYWRYAQDLDWGYFDHPPFTALMIKAGTSIFGGELGVRFFTVIFGFVSLFLIWKLLDKEYRQKPYAVFVFFMLWFSLPVFNIYTFITVPDSPLLFFALLYIIILKKFKQNSNIINALLLGFITALMFYSKYHGVLLVFFTIIADLKLLKNKNFYLALLFTTILFLPHLIWQYNNDFPSVRYHLYERNSSFAFKNIVEYPLNILLILNPFLFIYFLIKSFAKNKRYKPDKTMLFIFWGFIFFFWFSAFKGHVEPHWTAVSSIPLMIFIFEIAIKSDKDRKKIKILSLISIIILFSLRLFLIFDILPVRTEFHGNKNFVKKIEEKAGDIPVIFMSNYAKASKYSRYSGKIAYSRTNIHLRKSQYTLWDCEKSFYMKPVFYISKYSQGFMKDYLKIINKDTCLYYYHIFKHYVPVQKIKVFISEQKKEIKLNTPVKTKLKIYNSYNFDIKTDIPEMEISIAPVIFMPDNTKKILNAKTEIPETFFANDTCEVQAEFTVKNIPPGKYYLAFSLKNGKIFPKKEERKIEINIVK